MLKGLNDLAQYSFESSQEHEKIDNEVICTLEDTFQLSSNGLIMDKWLPWYI
jgi:hypothetical protein